MWRQRLWAEPDMRIVSAGIPDYLEAVPRARLLELASPRAAPFPIVAVDKVHATESKVNQRLRKIPDQAHFPRLHCLVLLGYGGNLEGMAIIGPCQYSSEGELLETISTSW